MFLAKPITKDLIYCPKTNVLLYFLRIFSKKKSDYVTDKIPVQILVALAKYRQAAKFLLQFVKTPTTALDQLKEKE